MRKDKKRQNQGKEAERICKVWSYSSSKAQLGGRRKEEGGRRGDTGRTGGAHKWCSCEHNIGCYAQRAEESFWPEWHFAFEKKGEVP